MMAKETVSQWQKSILRKIPSTEELLASDKISLLQQAFPRGMVANTARGVLGSLRQQIISLGKAESFGFNIPSNNELVSEIEKELYSKSMPSFRRAINAAGIVLHTALGRAVLAREVFESLGKELAGYTRIAADLETGKRQSRDKILEELICEITGAEAATITNNNAAATVLILNTLAKGREVICSRGQMVEIGGSFRIPDIMSTSGAKLVEIGTTNRTHLKDYEKAISKETGALLRVHNSNYKIIGFTADVPLEELVKVGKKHKIPVIDDIGSGALVDLSDYGFKDEPLVSGSIKAGADVICFSADKLLGGPQGGIIIGKKKYIEKIRKNPLMRAFRLGKLSLIALEATFKLFRNKETLFRTNPTIRMLTMDIKTITAKAESFRNILQTALPELEVKALDEYSQPGSGSLSGYDIPTKAVSVRLDKISAQALADKLRDRELPVFTRVKGDRVLFDFRTILDGEDAEIIKALKSIL
ncbi:MAG: L-seryl-tRNA(Sec) selenium transferase [Planctomycetes bacterium]|nr:L-seryl-tRNA(Sec) selenium transferase [Planctomycetota bacterium]